MKDLYNTGLNKAQGKNEANSRVFLSTENTVSYGSSLVRPPLFSGETLNVISKLGEVLQRIDRRMKNEGFCIKNGKIIRSENA